MKLENVVSSVFLLFNVFEIIVTLEMVATLEIVVFWDGCIVFVE